ncbi:MAG: glycosyltransferase [Oscillospiraceae bacterium]|nr:glycosyltransferase [Oscillospiraceae bacterium]
MNEPRLSVILPVYKAEHYLERCIDSVLVQSFSDYELILVDDGSPDNSGLICDEYASRDQRVRVIHQQNSGSSAARNAGIKDARGEYIYFVDSDDYIEQGLFAAALKAVEGFDLLTINFRKVDDSGEELERHIFNDTVILFESDYERFLFLAGVFFDFRIGFSPWNHFYKRSIIHDNGLSFRDGVIIAEDLCFNFCYLMHADSITFLPGVYYNYLQHSDSVMGMQKCCYGFERMNDLSRSMKNYLLSLNGFDLYKEYYPIIHIQLMNNAVERARENDPQLSYGRIRTIMQEEISDYNFFAKECHEVIRCVKILDRIKRRPRSLKMYYEFKFYADGNVSSLHALQKVDRIVHYRKLAKEVALRIRDKSRQFDKGCTI